MPVYNGQKFLREAINDGSSDSSLEILNEYKEIDSRIMVVDNNDNLGDVKKAIGFIGSNNKYLWLILKRRKIKNN
jgi:glycosyltransferase involved in cell wall biosynthesis